MNSRIKMRIGKRVGLRMSKGIRTDLSIQMRMGGEKGVRFKKRVRMKMNITIIKN